MRFPEAFKGWQDKGLKQEETGQLLGVSGPTFWRQMARFEAEGMQGLIGLRMSQVSSLRAPADEVLGLPRLYSSGFLCWNVKHFHTWYGRAYSWLGLRVCGHHARRVRGALPRRYRQVRAHHQGGEGAITGLAACRALSGQRTNINEKI